MFGFEHLASKLKIKVWRQPEGYIVTKDQTLKRINLKRFATRYNFAYVTN